mmetsp:Transcript_33183/g.69827  ORF Transcript_33183/g.69827 Transcript_33183/m.69827 type:complete len:143 (+) Transcript_33183:138-566(+)
MSSALRIFPLNLPLSAAASSFGVPRVLLRAHPLSSSGYRINHAPFIKNKRIGMRPMSASNGLYNPGNTKSSASRRKTDESQHEMSMKKVETAPDTTGKHPGKFMKGEVRILFLRNFLLEQLGTSYTLILTYKYCVQTIDNRY